MTRKPAIVLVHGAWLTPATWDPIVAPLESPGYEVARPRLPSTGGDPVVPDMTGNVEAIRSSVVDLLDQDKSVLVVLHSYGGMQGGNALEGLDAASREASGKDSHVVRLVYVSAYLVVEDTQLNPKGTRDNMIPEMVTDFEKGIVTAHPEGARQMLFQDVSDTYYAELTMFAAWRHIPTTYVHTLKDLPSTVAIQYHLVDAAKASGEHKIDKQIERDVGHCPYLTQPEWSVEMLRSEAEEIVA